MKKIFLFTGLVAVVVVCILFSRHWKADKPRRTAIKAVMQLNDALASSDDTEILKLTSLPPAYAGRTDAEKLEFIRKALRDEISEEGLRRLLKEGEFGPLSELFPKAGKEWAAKANVSVDDCVAFKLKKDGILSELAIYTGSTPHRIIRANNIRAL